MREDDRRGGSELRDSVEAVQKVDAQMPDADTSPRGNRPQRISKPSRLTTQGMGYLGQPNNLSVSS